MGGEQISHLELQVIPSSGWYILLKYGLHKGTFLQRVQYGKWEKLKLGGKETS